MHPATVTNPMSRRIVIGLLLSTMISLAAFAAGGEKPEEPAPEIPLPKFERGQKIVAAARAHPQKVKAGENLTLFLKVRISPGHHIYAFENTGSAEPTKIEANLRKVATGHGWTGPKPADEKGTSVYKGEVLFQSKLHLRHSTAPGKYTIPVKMTFQVCNEALCWPPETLIREVEVEVTK